MQANVNIHTHSEPSDEVTMKVKESNTYAELANTIQ